MHRLTGALVMMLAVAGCGSGNSTGPQEPLEVVASHTPASPSIGDTVTLRAKLINGTDEVLEFELASSCPFVMRVESADSLVAFPRVGCLTVIVPVELNPGDSLADSFTWIPEAAGSFLFRAALNAWRGIARLKGTDSINVAP